jgi:hypothetical protein
MKARISAATFSRNIANTRIAIKNKKPTNAAKRLGALSTGRLGIDSFLIRIPLMMLSILNLP